MGQSIEAAEGVEPFGKKQLLPIFASLTRCQCHAVWPDLAKIRHFDIILNVLGNSFLSYYLVFDHIWPTLANVYAIGHFFIVVNDQLLKNNLAIWSQQCVNVPT